MAESRRVFFLVDFSIGGALITFLSSALNRRYSGGSFGFFFTPTLSFDSDITRPPDRSEHPRLDVCQRLTQALARIALCRLVDAH